MYGLLEISDSSGKILANSKQNFDIDIEQNQLYLHKFRPLRVTRKGKLHGLVIRDPKQFGIIFSFPLDTNIIVDIGQDIYITPTYVTIDPDS